MGISLKHYVILATLAGSLCLSDVAAAFRPDEVAYDARQGFEAILDLWRSEDYGGLFARLEYPPSRGWEYFAQRIVHASRVPACCWEKLQDVKVSVIDGDRVTIKAKVGFEVEGVGTRFVTREFKLRRVNGVWKLPMDDVLDLSDFNLQRIPRKIYERQP